MVQAETDDDLLARVRGDVGSSTAYFNHAGMSLTPRPVLERMQAHLALESEQGGYDAAEMVAAELASVPSELAPLFGPAVPAAEVVAVESAGRAWEAILWSLAETFDYGPGDHIVIDQFAYASIYATLLRLRAATGVRVEVLPAGADGAVDLERLADALQPRTRLVSITHMPTHVGTCTDAAAVGRILAGHDAVFVLDVAQTIGQMPIDVAAIGCAVAYGPGRKFLRAPRGTGALYVASALAEQVVPLSLSFGSVEATDLDTLVIAPGARRFDSSEFGYAARLGLGAAAAYATDIGLDRIARLVADRSRQVVEALGSVPGARVLAAPDPVGIIPFVHDGAAPDEVRAQLGARGVRVWVNLPAGAPLDAAARPVLPSVRVSPHYLTDGGDIERLVDSVAGITPT